LYRWPGLLLVQKNKNCNFETAEKTHKLASEIASVKLFKTFGRPFKYRPMASKRPLNGS
jgi:hypothetical protein